MTLDKTQAKIAAVKAVAEAISDKRLTAEQVGQAAVEAVKSVNRNS